MPHTQTPDHTKGRKGSLSSALSSPDVLASSSSILNPSRPGAGARGLQQFFTPPEVSKLADYVLGLSSHATFDPTAGNGSLLTSAPAALRYGVEIDAEHVDEGNYKAIRGDIQRVYPLLRLSGIRFGRVLANPPFGLDDWSDPVLSGGKKINSTLLTYRYSLRLLERGGAGLIVAGRDRFSKLVLASPDDARSVVCTIEIDDLFEDVELPCVVAFFAESRSDEPIKTFSASREELSLPAVRADIRDAVRKGTSLLSHSSFYCSRSEESLKRSNEFDVIQTEYDKRVSGRNLTQQYDVMLVNGKLSIKVSPFAQLALSKANKTADLRVLESLNRQSASYFALNVRDWNLIKGLVDADTISIDPVALSHIENQIERGRMQLRPMYALPAQMKLGYLDDLSSIKCAKSDPEKGFLAGEFYPISVRSDIETTEETRLYKDRDGKQTPRRFKKEAKVLRITIDAKPFSETSEDVDYITEHFEIPDPGDLQQNHPAELDSIRSLLGELAEANGYEYADEQLEDLARCILKERSLLAWAPGWGKTLGILSCSEAWVRTGVAKNKVLIVAPQDLHDQWQRELQKFLSVTGRTLEPILTIADAERVRRHLKSGGEGWYIISYEALSIVGTSPTKISPVKLIDKGQVSADPDSDSESSRFALTSTEACPSCRTDQDNGWSGTSCTSCGYVHYDVRVKSIGSRLSTAFKDGVICVDELSMVRGDYSQRSLALRGLRSRCRIGASGTPISNYVNDIFHGLAWTIGWGSPRFPYDYNEGKAKFERDFCVIEHMMGSPEKSEEHKKQRRKVLPEVTNLAMLWKLLSINMVRRRQQDAKDMVSREFHTIETPMGVNQLRFHQTWLNGFDSFFTERNPDHPLVEAGLVEKFQAALGMLWKLEYASTLPCADPNSDWAVDRFGAKREDGESIELSNFTPKFIKTLELIEQQVEKGEKVLVGSCLVETGPMICKLLALRGIKAQHITEVDSAGKARTKNPRKRAAAVTDFITGDTQVLCAGVQALKLGHNLDVASSVFLIGTPWSYEAFEQFLARVWRRTSPKTVSVFVMIAKDSLDERKYDLLSKKSAASDVALDGKLIDEKEKAVDWNKVLKEMRMAGIKAQGDEVPEDALEAAWRARPMPKLRSLYSSSRVSNSGIKPLAGVSAPKYTLDVARGEQTSFFD